ncbi:563_t:CDS:2 [Acaulospora morrowiae]|uniref:563_t:CDS:1 n=1 Tax=Acaulospora morrowiae TaxID=94023 RepID=A0A9N9AYB9_9GLOM|nr:563_t:CDS:2 [Acaulospora morrowiae]
MSGYSFLTSGAPRQPGESKWKYHIRKLFTLKTLTSLDEDRQNSNLAKTLNLYDLIMISLGAIIGSGIFVLTGEAAATKSGPAVVISFLLAGVTASFAALSYCELTSMIPISGSSYTFVYATMGELIAWIIGWDLILEYLVGAAAVAVGWSGYFVSFFADCGVILSKSWTSAPVKYDIALGQFHIVPNAYFNVPAFLVVIFLTILLTIGIKESARVNTTVVSIKLLVIIIFCIAAGTRVNPDNYKPFIPENEGTFSRFGFTGVLAGTSVVFFAFIGFDSISTTAQETKNPQRDVPIAIMTSFAIVSVVYVAVSLVLVGVVPYRLLASPAPLAVAADMTGMKWLGIIVDLGAVCGLISVILVSLMGQPRIFLAMAKQVSYHFVTSVQNLETKKVLIIFSSSDGLFLPSLGSRIHPRFQTPYLTTILCGTVCAITAALFPIDILSELTSVGTLLAFFFVNIGVMVLRLIAPDAPRKFKVPGGPVFIPITGASLNLLLLATASRNSIIRLFIWMAIGLLVYVFYGRRHSKANNSTRNVDLDNEMMKTNVNKEAGL